MAPEIFKDGKHGIEADIWSLGVLLFEMNQGTRPFRGNSKTQVIESIKNCISLKVNNQTSGEYFDLIKKLL